MTADPADTLARMREALASWPPARRRPRIDRRYSYLCDPDDARDLAADEDEDRRRGLSDTPGS